MNTQDWALITFTILAQMSVGAFVVLGFIHYFAVRKGGLEAAERLSDRALLAIGPVMVLGLIASLLHLGSPLTAPTAILNIGKSWLSREVLFGVLFAAFGGAFAFAQWRKIGTYASRNILAWIATVFGLALVFCMSMVYMLDSQPAWNNLATPILFFATTFLLGSLAIGVAFAAIYGMSKENESECAKEQCELLRKTIFWIAIASMVLLGIELVTIPILNAYLAGNGIPQAAASASAIYANYGFLFALRLLLVFLGAGMFGMFLFRTSAIVGSEKTLSNLVYVAFTLVLAAEVIGRFLFYATHVKIGLL